MKFAAEQVLPDDAIQATLVGRAWVPGRNAGPSPVLVADAQAWDLSRVAPTTSELLNLQDPVRVALDAVKPGWPKPLGATADWTAIPLGARRDGAKPYLLTPCDLQALRACGVTFVSSMLERVIEEHAKGDQDKADEIRRSIGAEIGAEIKTVKPGTAEAKRVKESLIRRNLWSQYLEVGIGPDAEVFNKSQPMSAVGLGAEIGVRADSSWNNPEPEVVLAINRAGRVVGAALGNDVNLRDFEGRSALLLGKAKDNNASCAIGPFIRLFDRHYGVDDLRRTHIRIEIAGPEGYRLAGESHLANISRDPLDPAGQAVNRTHQYPDGTMLFLGTQFAPVQDRDQPGKGFTHKIGDVVSIRADSLGMLVNRVNHCDKVAPWTYGVNDLMRNLASRGLL